jgi:hypothetical protein
MSILTVFIIALIISLLFAPGYRQGSFSPLLLFFFVLFLGGLAGHYWIIPFGPVWWGVSWMPLLFIMLLFLFLLSASSPYDSYRSKANKSVEASASAAVGLFVWMLLILLFVAVIIGFLNPPTHMKNEKIKIEKKL